MKQFIVLWLDKSHEIVEGKNIADAFTLAGLGGGAVRAVDTYFEYPETQNDLARMFESICLNFSIRLEEIDIFHEQMKQDFVSGDYMKPMYAVYDMLAISDGLIPIVKSDEWFKSLKSFYNNLRSADSLSKKIPQIRFDFLKETLEGLDEETWPFNGISYENFKNFFEMMKRSSSFAHKAHCEMRDNW